MLGVRYSVRGLMIVVAGFAGLFSVRSLWTVIVLAFACPVFALIAPRWLLSRDYRRPAAIWFGIVATTVNALYAASCIYPIEIVLIILFILLFAAVPIILSFGVAWATMATKELRSAALTAGRLAVGYRGDRDASDDTLHTVAISHVLLCRQAQHGKLG